MTNDYLVSLIRTLVPVIVGAAATALLRLGVEVDTTAAVAVLQPVVIGAYYALVRWLEGRSRRAGWLLGFPKPPTY